MRYVITLDDGVQFETDILQTLNDLPDWAVIVTEEGHAVNFPMRRVALIRDTRPIFPGPEQEVAAE